MRDSQCCPSFLVFASSNDTFKRYDFAPAFLRHGGVHKPTDFIRRAKLHLAGHMGVSVQREAGAVMAEHTGQSFHIDTALHRQRRECVPIRYNYDKPENPVFMVV